MIDRRMLMAGGGAVATLGMLGLTGCDSRLLRILGEDSSNLKAIGTVLDSFQQNTGVRAETQLLDFETLMKQSDIDLSASGAPRYDIICQYNFALSSYVRNKYVLDVPELKRAAPNVDFGFEQDIIPNVWRELGFYSENGHDSVAQPIAYPFAANTMILVASKRVLSDASVARELGRDFTLPTQWADLAKAAQAVTKANNAYRGIVLQGAAGGWLYYEWVNFLFGLGGKVMDKAWGWASDLNTPLTLRSPKTTEAVELYLSLKSVNAGDFLRTDAVKQRDIMLDGNTAFAIMWTDYIPDLVAHDKDGFLFAPVPGSSSMIAGGSYFVNRRTAQAADTGALISYLMQPGTQKRLALAGLFPPTRSALNDADVLLKPYMPAVRQSLERGTYMNEAGPDADLINAALTDALQRAWRGELRPEEVGPRATAAINEGREALRAAQQRAQHS